MLDRPPLPEWVTLTEEEKAEIIRPLAESNATSTAIAAAFMGASKNAIIGFCHRHGIALLSRVEKARRPEEQRKAEERAARYRAKIAVERKAAEADLTTRGTVREDRKQVARNQALARAIQNPTPVMSKGFMDIRPDGTPARVSLLDIGRHQCRWPVGDPREPGFGFCGETTRESSSYCARHHAKVYIGKVRLDA